MAKIQKFVTQTDWLWYHAEITEEQAQEYRDYETALALNGNAEEPEWLWDLDFDLVRDKPASDDTEFELIEE